MNVTLSHMVGACIGLILWFGVGWTYGGWFWLPFAVMCVPLSIVALGFAYGLLGGGDSMTFQEAKLEAMDRHVDHKEDRNDE